MNYLKLILFIVPVFLVTLIAGCTSKTVNSGDLQEKITNLDKAGWEAWKNKNGKWFEENTTKNFISISADDVSSRDQVIKSTVTDCDIKSYNLNNIEFTELTEESVLLTYTVDQEGTCGGVKLNTKIRAAANYIKQNDKWLEAFYMESKID
ncbi:MAG TPA: nuclear transport factor 2 family protein [Ignavibacteria bacterium]|nr:nuclear transport factor 2 family protein [Ignavibacteria bacterium]